MRKRRMLTDVPWVPISELGDLGLRLDRAMSRRVGRSTQPFEARRWGGSGWKVRDPETGRAAIFSDTGRRLIPWISKGVQS
jgi:hypothetical protein